MRGQFIPVCHTLCMLGRDVRHDSAYLYVVIITLKCTMNALFLKDLALKTKRGLEGRINKGRSAGGNAYGYDVVREYGPDGPIDRGRRTINGQEARVVVKIFTQYLNGESPRVIAAWLNAQKTCGPRGRTGLLQLLLATANVAPASLTTNFILGNLFGIGKLS